MMSPTASDRAERLYDLACQLDERLRSGRHDLAQLAHEARQEAAWLAGYVQAAAARQLAEATEGGAR